MVCLKKETRKPYQMYSITIIFCKKENNQYYHLILMKDIFSEVNDTC